MTLSKLQSGQRVRQMTGERESFRIHHDEASSPPIHTGFRIDRIIVRRDEEHFHFSLKSFPRLSRNGSRAFELFASRQERRAVLESPSKILRVRQLKSIGRQRVRPERSGLRSHAMLSRWSTTFRVSGSPSEVTHCMASSFRLE